MNRLWVRISILVAVIVLFVAAFPITLRWADMGNPPFQSMPWQAGMEPRIPPGPPPDISAERWQEIQREVEIRLWTRIARELLIAGALGILAGFLISRWMMKPLQNLKNGAEAVSNAKYTYRIPETGTLEMKSVARSFNHMAERLETQERLRQNLLADVAHELRHPAHLLRGNLQAILDGVYPLEMSEIASLHEQTETLARLVEDLQLLAQAESRELSLEIRPVDLTTIVNKAVDMIHFLGEEREITLDTNLPQNPIVLPLDPDRILLVLLNLLNNAVRFTEKGGHVWVSVEQAADRVLLKVQDDGIGLEPAELEHVFDRFYQADPSRDRRYGGTGLGLAITQALVQAHGGKISVQSPGRGRGSTFEVEFQNPPDDNSPPEIAG